MTQQEQPAAIVSWDEPSGLNPRGTVIVLPGRGERPEVYERFGRRLSADAYRVRAVVSPAEHPALADEQVRTLLDGPGPVVLAGSDTGALFAVTLAASGRLPEAAALVLAGLPTAPDTGAEYERASDEGRGLPPEPKRAPLSWTEERRPRDEVSPGAEGRAPAPGLRREGARDERASDEGGGRGPERPEASGGSRATGEGQGSRARGG